MARHGEQSGSKPPKKKNKMKDREKRLRGVERQRQERLQPKLPAGGKKVVLNFSKELQ